MNFGYSCADSIGGIVLVTAHNLQYAVLAVWYGIESYHLVSHWNREKSLNHLVPLVDGFIVEVCPMEIKILIEYTVRTRIGKV